LEKLKFIEVIKEKYLKNKDLSEADRVETYDALFHTGDRIIKYLGSHDRILVSVSGGSDSDCIIHLLCTYFPEYLEKCHFVFVNTGLEFDATKRHIQAIQEKYGIEIKEIRGKSVVYAIKEYGFPILSKYKSELIRKYNEGQPHAHKWIFEEKVRSFKAMAWTEPQKKLAQYIKDNGIKVSAKCCDISKKAPLFQYIKDNDIDLNITGERKAEGGQRALAHNSCFEEGNHGVDKYMPLWWWNNWSKRAFKIVEGIRYSDCYEVYGMKRTGCVGCPFNIYIAQDLTIMSQCEPQLYKACMNVFGESYRLMDQFHARKRKCVPDCIPMSLF
jgi:3'-phosphoadenosine 5'-phosphosulfate sulfotransferase (PAPS reductase)/FAD synthetase